MRAMRETEIIHTLEEWRFEEIDEAAASNAVQLLHLAERSAIFRRR